jgi:hypothetical protein
MLSMTLLLFLPNISFNIKFQTVQRINTRGGGNNSQTFYLSHIIIGFLKTEKKESLPARLVFISGLFAMLLGFPVLSIVNVPGRVLGVPALYLYIFSMWSLLIGILAYLLRRHPHLPPDTEDE